MIGRYNSPVHLFQESSVYKQRYKHHVRIVNIILTTTIVYVVSQTPYYITFLTFGAHPSNSVNKSKTLNADLDALGLSYMQYYIISFVTLITYSIHLAVNPIIYSIIDVKWRHDFKAVLVAGAEYFANCFPAGKDIVKVCGYVRKKTCGYFVSGRTTVHKTVNRGATQETHM